MKTPTPTPRLLDDLRSLPRPFWVLFAGTFINRFGTFVWPFLTLYLTRQGHSLTAASCALASWGLGSFAGNALGGWLADHLGRRDTIVGGTLAAAMFLMCLYGAESLPAILLFTALCGLANGTYHPAASALLADVVSPELRVRAYAAFRLAANAGFACGAAVGGILANYSFFWLFAGDALTTAAYSAVALFALPHGLRGQTRRAPWTAALGQLRHDRSFHGLFAATFCSALIVAQFGSTFSLHVTRAGLSLDLFGWHAPAETIYGLLIGWNGVLIVLCELPISGWTQRFAPRRTMACGYLLLGGGFALNATSHHFPMLFAAMTIFTLGEMISVPVSSAYLARLAPLAMRGRYLGALAMAWNAAAILGPLGGFPLFQLAPQALWIVCGLLGCIAAALILRTGRAATSAATVNQLARPAPAGVCEGVGIAD